MKRRCRAQLHIGGVKLFCRWDNCLHNVKHSGLYKNHWIDWTGDDRAPVARSAKKKAPKTRRAR